MYRIVQGDRSYFSLEFMAKNVELLSLPVSIDACLFDEQGDLLAEEKILSRFGRNKIEELKIPIVTKDSIDNLLRASFEVPQSSISELVNWKKELVTNFIGKEQREMIFNT